MKTLRSMKFFIKYNYNLLLPIYCKEKMTKSKKVCAFERI